MDKIGDLTRRANGGGPYSFLLGRQKQGLFFASFQTRRRQAREDGCHSVRRQSVNTCLQSEWDFGGRDLAKGEIARRQNERAGEVVSMHSPHHRSASKVDPDVSGVAAGFVLVLML